MAPIQLIEGMNEQTKNGSEEVTCENCCCPAGKPYRWVHEGKIIEGCISNFHTGHIPATETESLAWHNREWAQAWRAKAKFDFNPATGFWVR